MIWHPELSVIESDDIGDGCTIHAFVWIGPGVKIGDRCKIQAFAYIPPGVVVGNDVFIGPRVTFTNDRHPPTPGYWLVTIVEDGVSIGAGAVILPSITIGAGATIGAGSVVTKDVAANTTVKGNPAR